MKVWATIAVLISSAVFQAEGAFSPDRSVEISGGLTAVVGAGVLRIDVVAHPGDAWTRLARRITGDAANWREIADRNGMNEVLMAGATVSVPWSLVRHEIRLAAIRALFPADGRSNEGWIHEISLDRGEEGESLWEIAEWFTDAGTNYSRIVEASGQRPLSTRIGERVVIPEEILIPELASLPARPQIEPARSREVPFLRGSSAGSDESELLEYELTGTDPYATYRLREGEAIYSSVAIRFTGRVHADDVSEAVRELIRFNGIEDVSRLPVGYRVRIPVGMLTDQYLPRGNPRREAWEAAARNRGAAGVPMRALRLEGVHVIIDPGHGGRDVGASSGETWESNYVYDIALRLRKQLESRSGATVWMTTHSRELEAGIRSGEISGVNDHVLNTDPVYELESPTVGVNLRWYLSNAILTRLVSRGVPRERVIFLSLHADSLHPSLQGAMAYIPGHQYVQGTYSKHDSVYLARREVRENPISTVSLSDAKRGEALSHELATAVLDAMAERELHVHPFTSIRDHVVRKGREWVPAVIRHNQVYSRVLLEVCNLGNEEDRRLLRRGVWREEVARAIFDGINRHFSSDESVEPASAIAAR